ncbi:DinB family protein [Falsibacillus albus]|uniref:DinB family protein n=1 Tax=Falsibacillus albus TaxID=2478915 RepID=A0A3L7JZL3_9BACI|nr:DinB family protein [Falsibacillus albus]RLQ96298.1 DinB family protein [Falsibacillus albus]
MNKKQIIEKKSAIAQWSSSLKTISEENWYQSFREGSWGIADVISHFITWDEFIMKHRLDYLIKDKPLPIFHVDVQAMNKEAMHFARSGIDKDDLIDEFVKVRKELVALIESIPEEKFNKVVWIGKREMTLSNYFEGLIEHDEKHKQEIDESINYVYYL